MQGFEIDHKAFRAQNSGRPPEHLIRELIQNSFDESPKNVWVVVEPAASKGLIVSVIDDGPGFEDEKEIWTIFASGKRDDHTKRGRLGRGLKELVSVANTCVIETRSKRITFSWDRHDLSRKVGRIKAVTGTRVEAYVPLWTKAAIEPILAYLRLFIAPQGTTLWVNGEVNVEPALEHEFRAMLPTVVFKEDGVPQDTYKTTTVRMLTPRGDRWIYEMGIPVEKIPDEDAFRWSIDVGQRTPLRPERDMLPRQFVHALYAYVANEMVERLPVEELSALWMEEGVGNHNFDSNRKGKVYVTRRFGEQAARAIVNDPHDRNVLAQQNGVNVVKVEQLSSSVRDVVRNALPTTAQLYPVPTAPTRFIPQAEWTEGEQRFIAFAKWAAVGVGLVEPTIMVLDAPAAACEADSSESGTLIRVNRSGLGERFFSHPRIALWLPLIAHELAHRTGNGHDHVFWREVERISGEAAEWVFNHPARAKELMGV